MRLACKDRKGSVTQIKRLASEVDMEAAGVSERITAKHHPTNDDQMAVPSGNGGTVQRPNEPLVSAAQLPPDYLTQTQFIKFVLSINHKLKEQLNQASQAD